MLHRTLRRVTLALVAGLAIAALAFGLALRGVPQAGQKPPPQTAAGKLAFGRYCAGCHDAGEFVAESRDPDGAARLIRLLEKHGRAPPDEDLLIVAFLAEPDTG